MGYQILADGDANELEKNVNLFLERGWILQGGVSVTIGPRGFSSMPKPL
jgi:hypothetical protein